MTLLLHGEGMKLKHPGRTIRKRNTWGKVSWRKKGSEATMSRLEEITRGAVVKGVLPDGFVTAVDVNWIQPPLSANRISA